MRKSDKDNSQSPGSTPRQNNSSVEMNGSRKSLSNKSGSPSVERLSKLKESLYNISGNLREEVEHKREIEESRLFEVREMVSKLENTINNEIKKRTEGDKSLQNNIDSQVNNVQNSLDKKISERHSQNQIANDILTKRVVSLEKEVGEMREKTNKMINDLKSNTLSQIEELQAQLENERIARAEKDAQLMKKISEETSRIQERLESEKAERDHVLSTVRDEADKGEKARDKSLEKFRSMMLDEIDILKQALRMETEAREGSEEQMMDTIDHIVNQLKESFRIVSK
eukprot:gb/GECH01006719.1/.p1 GENE.gb/GECH01006719.1/~~gb/GECH01006719.1/.p1  ORF type:complete len:285 (+),score=79.38 gb/GECH01006719.1/:1-855(+)